MTVNEDPPNPHLAIPGDDSEMPYDSIAIGIEDEASLEFKPVGEGEDGAGDKVVIEVNKGSNLGGSVLSQAKTARSAAVLRS